MRLLPLLFPALFLAGCPTNPAPTDASSEAAVADAGSDSVLADNVLVDTTTSDIAPTDSGLFDATTTEASTDGATADATSADAPDDASVDGADSSAGCSADAVTMRLPGLLFTSESDFPLDYAAFPGEGASAPTTADVARLSSASASATLETRDETWFWTHVVVDPTRTPPAPDTQIGELRAAFESLASDRIVVRVIEPSDPARVHVYLAGRTTCGSLVWLASISIET